MFDCLGKTKHNRKKKEGAEKKKGQRRGEEEEEKEEAGYIDLNLGCSIYIICPSISINKTEQDQRGNNFDELYVYDQLLLDPDCIFF